MLGMAAYLHGPARRDLVLPRLPQVVQGEGGREDALQHGNVENVACMQARACLAISGTPSCLV